MYAHRNRKTLTRFKCRRRMISILLLWYLEKIIYLVFVGIIIPFHNPFCTISGIHMEGVRSIFSFIKCPSVIEQMIFVLKAPTGMVYNGIQAAYIGLGILGYFCMHLVSTKHCRFVCFRFTSHLLPILYYQWNTHGWSSQYLLIYKMSISDYKQTIFGLKAIL